MAKVHLVMPMAGAGSRFAKQGYDCPKPLMHIQGKPFFYWAAMSVAGFVRLHDITFVVLQEHVEQHHIDRAIHEFFPQASIIVLSQVLPGPVFTALVAVEKMPSDGPVVFNDCDHLFYCPDMYQALNAAEFTAAGGLLTFASQEPQFSYVRYGAQQDIIGTVEKQVVSEHAICGAYTFHDAAMFRSIADEYISKCPYNECFMSGMYNIMCERGLALTEFLLQYHVEFGTPVEYAAALQSELFQAFTQELSL